MKRRSIAIALALFFGSVGVHKFYIGQPERGILYFLFSWTFIPTILAICSIISWLLMTDDEFDRRFRMG